VKSYSQNGEDLIVWEYFQTNGMNSRNNSVLELGANDGVTLSNSRLFIENGWRATLVEPSPVAFKKLHSRYQGYTHIDCWPVAIARHKGKVTLHDMGNHLGRGDTGLLSTIVPAEKFRWPETTYSEIEVEGWTIDYLLSMSNQDRYLFISIDCEGMDYWIMDRIDFNSLACHAVCVEYNGIEQWKYDKVAEKFRFKLLHKNAENLIYVR
jgi:FkbM family methyltransferase